MSRNKRTRSWMQTHTSDTYVKQARQAGYRSRAAYKLLEIDERDHLLKPGMTVIDLGAAPGGWSQAAAAKVGAKGRVIAIDLLEMPAIPGVTFHPRGFHRYRHTGSDRGPARGRRCRPGPVRHVGQPHWRA